MFQTIRKKLKMRNYNAAHKIISAYNNIEGWLTEQEAYGLYKIAQQLVLNAAIVEIGSWKGKSTCCIANGLKKGVIYCIDPFNADGEEGSREIYEKTKGEKSLLQQFHENTANISNKVKINVLKGYSSDFVTTISNIDFLFIDGDHSIEGCKFDFEHYSKALNIGGYLAFHDYYPDRADLGPTWVIDNLVKTSSSYKLIDIFDSLVIFKKIKL